MTPLASLAQAWPAKQAIKLAAVAAAAPHGYTFAVVFDSHGVNPSLIPGLPFDSKKDLSPVVLIGTAPMVLGTPAGSEFKTLADVVAAARSPKGASYGTIGSGSLGHLAMAMLGKGNGLDFQHISYKGGGPLMNDAVAGHVPLAIGPRWPPCSLSARWTSGARWSKTTTSRPTEPRLRRVPAGPCRAQASGVMPSATKKRATML